MVLYAPRIQKCIFGNGGRAALLLARYERITFMGRYLIVAVLTPFTQILTTRVCFTNAGVNTYGTEIHKLRKHAIYAFPSFLFLILLFRLYVKELFSEM